MHRPETPTLADRGLDRSTDVRTPPPARWPDPEERLGDLTLCTFETAESLATSRLWIGPQPSGAGARPLAIDDGPGACAPEPPPRRAIGAPEPPRQAIGAEACDELRKVISEVSSSSNNRRRHRRG